MNSSYHKIQYPCSLRFSKLFDKKIHMLSILLSIFIAFHESPGTSQTLSPSISDLEAQSVSGAKSAHQDHVPLGVILTFGPNIGSGRGSENAAIRYASGFDLSLAKLFSLEKNIGLPISFGPQLALSNMILDTKFDRDAESYTGRYDLRTGAVGLRVKWAEGYGVWNTPFYTSVMGGLTFSKLGLNRTTAETFQKIDVHKINGRSLQVELGTGFALTDRFDLMTSWTNTLYRLDQTNAQATFEGEYLDDRGLGLLQGTYTPAEVNAFLAPYPTLRMWAIKVGFAASL